MPREFDSKARESMENPPPLAFSSNLDCPMCGTTFDGLWFDSSLSVEDMVEAPVADQTCPHCGCVMPDEEWPGWMWTSEA